MFQPSKRTCSASSNLELVGHQSMSLIMQNVIFTFLPAKARRDFIYLGIVYIKKHLPSSNEIITLQILQPVLYKISVTKTPKIPFISMNLFILVNTGIL